MAKKTYKIFLEIVYILELTDKINPQNLMLFVVKILNILIPDSKMYYWVKHELAIFLSDFISGLYKQIKRNKADFYTPTVLQLIGSLIYLSLRGLKHPTVSFERVNQHTISNLCGISEVTLRKHIKNIIERLQKYDKDLF